MKMCHNGVVKKHKEYDSAQEMSVKIFLPVNMSLSALFESSFQ